MLVLRLRHELRGAELAALTGEQMVALSVERGWSSGTSYRDVMVADVRIDGTQADLSFTIDIRSVFLTWEAGAWKISLWKTFPQAELDLQRMFEQSGETDEIAWMVATLNATSSRAFDVALLDGPPR